MRTRIFPLFKSLLQALLLFVILAAMADWWRKPRQPAQSDFVLTTLSHSSTSLERFSYRRSGVIYFWANWCPVCRYTSPVVEKLHQSTIPVISIALQSGNDDTIRQYLQTHRLTFPTVNDSDGLIAEKWAIRATPTIIIVKNGKMIHHTSGLSSYWGLRLRILLSDYIN